MLPSHPPTFIQLALWQHKSKANLLGLLQLNHGPGFYLEVLSLLRKILFSSGGGSSRDMSRAESGSAASASGGHCTLLEPSFLQTAASLLHPQMEPVVLTRVLHMLEMAASGANADAECLQGWHTCMFRMVPFLVPPLKQLTPGPGPGPHPACSAALSVLVALSDNPAFRNVFYASGKINTGF